MKKILLSLLCTFSLAAMAPPPGSAQLNGHAFYLLIKGIQDWFKKRNEPAHAPAPTAPTPAPPAAAPMVQPSGSLRTIVQVYFDENTQKVVVIAPEGVEVDILRSPAYIRFRPFQQPTDDE